MTGHLKSASCCCASSAHDDRYLSTGTYWCTESQKTKKYRRFSYDIAAAAVCNIIITTASQYVKNGITEWIHNWKKNGWKTANKTPVKNNGLWLHLDKAISEHKIQWEWIKGHSGHPQNERADELANLAIDNLDK